MSQPTAFAISSFFHDNPLAIGNKSTIDWFLFRPHRHLEDKSSLRHNQNNDLVLLDVPQAKHFLIKNINQVAKVIHKRI